MRVIGAAGARAHDGAGDAAREALLAVVADELGELRLGQRVDEIGGARAVARPMRMSSGPSARNEKPRSALVELDRRDAEIERHAVQPQRCRAARSSSLHLAEAPFDEREPAGIATRERGAAARPPAGSRSMRDDAAARRFEQRLGCTRRRRRCRRDRARRRAARARQASPRARTGMCAASLISGPARGAAASRCARVRAAPADGVRNGPAPRSGRCLPLPTKAAPISSTMPACSQSSGGSMMPALAVERQLLRVGEDRGDRVALVGKFGQRVDAGVQFLACGRCRSPRAPRLLTAGKTTMPGKDWPASAARNGAGTDTRPLRSTLLTNVERNSATPGSRPSPMTCKTWAPPPVQGHGTEWDIMGLYGCQTHP